MIKPIKRIAIASTLDNTYFSIVKQFADKQIDLMFFDDIHTFEMLEFNKNYVEGFLFDLDYELSFKLLNFVNISFDKKPCVAYYSKPITGKYSVFDSRFNLKYQIDTNLLNPISKHDLDDTVNLLLDSFKSSKHFSYNR